VRHHIANLLRRLADKLAPPQRSLGDTIVDMLAGPTFEAVLKAVRKQNSDPGIQNAQSDVKRAEALEWAQHYTRKARPDAWETRFLTELAVGLEKGKLPKG